MQLARATSVRSYNNVNVQAARASAFSSASLRQSTLNRNVNYNKNVFRPTTVRPQFARQFHSSPFLLDLEPVHGMFFFHA